MSFKVFTTKEKIYDGYSHIHRDAAFAACLSGINLLFLGLKCFSNV